MGRVIRILAVSAVSHIFAVGCSFYLGEADRRDMSYKVNVGFNLEMAGEEGPNATFPARLLEDICICAYCDGYLQDFTCSDDGMPGSLSLSSGRSYTFYCMANMGLPDPPALESDMVSLRYRAESLVALSGDVLPMSAVAHADLGHLPAEVTLSLERLTARVVLYMENKESPGFRIISACIMNSPEDMSVFSPDSVQGHAPDGNCAGGDELEILNSGGGAVFHMLEYCQEPLFSGDTGTGAMEKYPYIEVKAVAAGGADTVEPVISRFCLGREGLSGVCIRRNTESVITVSFSSETPGGVSWRTDKIGAVSSGVSLVAVGDGGMVACTSGDGVTDVCRVGGSDWNDVMYADGIYVAAGDDGAIASSADCRTWHVCKVGDADYCAVAYGNGIFVAAGTERRNIAAGQDLQRNYACLAYSSDAISWSLVKEDDMRIEDIAYGNGLFLASAGYHPWYQPHTVNRFGYSSDGVHWEFDIGGNMTTVCGSLIFAEGRFLAMDSGTFFGSADGYVWDGPVESGFNLMSDVVYGAGKYLAVGTRGNIISSSDGENWKEVYSDLSRRFFCVTYGNDRFLASGEKGEIMCSADGERWSEVHPSYGWHVYGLCVRDE